MCIASFRGKTSVYAVEKDVYKYRFETRRVYDGRSDNHGELDMSRTHSASTDFRRQMEGYGLTTAQILYFLPDYPSILQTYVWQEYDLCPHFPVLFKFLGFWQKKIVGPLHSVRVAHSDLIRAAELKHIGSEFRLQ